jgi:hypothetical protein
MIPSLYAGDAAKSKNKKSDVFARFMNLAVTERRTSVDELCAASIAVRTWPTPAVRAYPSPTSGRDELADPPDGVNAMWLQGGLSINGPAETKLSKKKIVGPAVTERQTFIMRTGNPAIGLSGVPAVA